MHGLPEWTQVSIFYNYVNTPTRMMLDASANGTLLYKPSREGLEILEKLDLNDYQHPTTRRGTMRRETAQLDSFDTILAQISAITNMVKNMQKQSTIQEAKALDLFCEICGSNHDTSECGQHPESSCYVGNFNRNAMSNTTSNQQGYQDQPKQGQQLNQPRQEYQEPNNYRTLENTLNTFMTQTSAYMARTDKLIQKTDAFMDRTEIKMQNQEVALNDTEVAKGTTHEKCKAILTRSGKVLNPPTESRKGEATVDNSKVTSGTDIPATADIPASTDLDHNIPPEPKESEITSAVHINLPLVEALQQIPNYAKFLKDMVSRKIRIGEFETAVATEACLAMMHSKVPTKKTDPGSFTIPAP
ncbi:hypothetical protein V6N12_068517 [Hibiscus sabdariffa]|uniref:Retrotransposon gag protein n=1 Tax=Hibiscus sabdariffa TaxID=183260 RepID=A0ABR2FQB8_9ROSI